MMLFLCNNILTFSVSASPISQTWMGMLLEFWELELLEVEEVQKEGK